MITDVYVSPVSSLSVSLAHFPGLFFSHPKFLCPVALTYVT